MTYSPIDLLLSLTDGAPVALGWVGVAVGAALVLFGAFYGIRAGFRFFRMVVGDGYISRKGDADPYNDGATGIYHEVHGK